MVGPQGFAGRGDVGNRLGRQVLHRALGGTKAVNQLVIGNALAGQKIAHQPVIFGGNAQPLAMRGAEGGGNRIQIVQRIHIDPGGRHGDDQIGMAKAQRRQFGHLHVPVCQLVADQVGPGHAQMDAPRRKFARNLAGRQPNQFRTLDAFDGAGILAV